MIGGKTKLLIWCPLCSLLLRLRGILLKLFEFILFVIEVDVEFVLDVAEIIVAPFYLLIFCKDFFMLLLE